MDDELYKMVEQVRKELHEMVDREVNTLLNRLKYGTPKMSAEITLPLSTMPAYFKGKKPVSVVYPDGNEMPATTWRKVAEELLFNCAEEPIMCGRLLDIRGKVFGRDRVIFDGTGEGMDRPVKFYPGMFFESKFDSETMLKVITKRIFEPIGYDYHRIGIKVIDPMIQAIAQKEMEVPASTMEANYNDRQNAAIRVRDLLQTVTDDINTVLVHPDSEVRVSLSVLKELTPSGEKDFQVLLDAPIQGYRQGECWQEVVLDGVGAEELECFWETYDAHEQAEEAMLSM